MRERRVEKQTLSRIEGVLDQMNLSDDEGPGAGPEDDGEMFATEIGGGLADGFTYTDTTRGMAAAFHSSVLDV